jgi:excisionase family DNA binding protein
MRRTRSPARRAVRPHALVSLRRLRSIKGAAEPKVFAPLLDAKEASMLLGVPHTWLLAQARAGRIPHHRLGHYVRFDTGDLRRWLDETRAGPLLDPAAPKRMSGVYTTR